MQVVKAVQQTYAPSRDLLELLEQFRRMLNDCIRIGLGENSTSMKSLSVKAYKELSQYDVMNYYKLCAISKYYVTEDKDLRERLKRHRQITPISAQAMLDSLRNKAMPR